MTENVTAFSVGRRHTAFLPSEGCPLKAVYRPWKCDKPVKHIMGKNESRLLVCGIHKKTLEADGWNEILRGNDLNAYRPQNTA